MSPREKRRKAELSEEVAVISSTEEESDAAEEREVLFGPEQDEGIEVDPDTPLRRPVPTDEPLDITPVTVIEQGFGLVDESDEATLKKYETPERKSVRKAG
jgi:hypothetical protein